MCHKYLLIDAVLVEAKTIRGWQAMLLKPEKAVAIHNIIAAHELHLCAKTILNENYRCVSTNLHSPYAKCFKIKAKKP